MEIVYRPNSQHGDWTHLGPYQLLPLIDRHQEARMTCYLVRLAPHSRTRTSFHGEAEEIYFVLSGRGFAILDGQRYELGPGTFLRLPPKTRHAFITEESPLELLDIHSPGSWPDRDLYFVDDPCSSEQDPPSR